MLDFMTRPRVSDYYQLRIFGVGPFHVFPLDAYRSVCFDVCIAVCLPFVCPLGMPVFRLCLPCGVSFSPLSDGLFLSLPVSPLFSSLLSCFLPLLCLSRRCLRPLYCLLLCLSRRCLPLYCLLLCLSRRCLPLYCLLLCLF